MSSGVRFLDFLICMIRENFNIVGYPLGIVKLSSSSLSGIKKQLLYQRSFSINKNDGHIVIEDLCGSYKSSVFGVPTVSSTYVIKKAKRDNSAYYTSDELKLVCNIINDLIYICDSGPHSRIMEILVRSTGDEELVSSFYNPLRTLFTDRLEELIKNPELCKNEDTIRERYKEVSGKDRYSVFKFLLDLEKAKGKTLLCIDKEIVGGYDLISKNQYKTPEMDSDVIWVPIQSLVFNSKRANISLMLRSEKGGLFNRTVIRDGVLWLSKIMIRTEDSRLRKRLYGSGAVYNTGVFNTDLMLDLTKLPIISKRDKVKNAKKLIDCCEKWVVEKKAYNLAKPITGKIDGAKKEEPKEKMTEDCYTYDSPCIVYKVRVFSDVNFSDYIKKTITDFDFETRKKELEKAKRNYQLSVFRFLCSIPFISRKVNYVEKAFTCPGISLSDLEYKIEKTTATLKTL